MPSPAQKPSSTQTSSGTPLYVGLAVRLLGLKNSPQLNGQLGTCEEWKESLGRWHVRLESSGEIKAIKPDNLEQSAPNAKEHHANGVRNRSRSRSPRRVTQDTHAGVSSASKSGSQAHAVGGPQSDLFKANLAKLKAKADEEATGQRPRMAPPPGSGREPTASMLHGKRARRDGYVDTRNPVAFVPVAFVPAQAAEEPTRKVVVLNAKGEELDMDSDDDVSIKPGQIAPPLNCNGNVTSPGDCQNLFQ